MKHVIFLIVGSLVYCSATAQTPFIHHIDPIAAFPGGTVLITGSGFSANPSHLQVWFEQVQGHILVSTEFSIEVEIPPEARLSPITVVNLANGQSAKSHLKFQPVFSGETFSAAKFSSPISFTTAQAAFDLVTGDIDGDNRPDIIGSKFENLATNIFFLHNQSTIGNVSFVDSNPASLIVNAPTGHLALGDLNADGKPDLVGSRSGTSANSVFILRNTSTPGSPDFATPVVLAMDLGHFGRQVAIHDLNQDGKPEVIVANSASNELYIYRNESSGGTLTINPIPTKVSVTGASNTLALEIMDVDGDKRPDILATQNQSNDLFILRNATTTSFTFTITKLPLFGTFNDLTSADFNNDSKMDLVATSVFGNQVVVLINQSTSSISFQAPITLPAENGPFGLDVSDFNGDGFADVLVANRGTAVASVFLNNKSLAPVSFTKTNLAIPKNNWFLRAGDLDGDAKPDLAISTFTNPSTFSVDVLRNQHCHVPSILNDAPLFVCPSQTIRLETIRLPGITYDWKKDGISFKSGADPFADISVAGSYTVTATGESGNCVVTSSALMVQSGAGTLPSDPVITTNSPVCEGQAITLTTPLVSGATYQWTGPGGFTANTQNVNISNATVAHAGTYSLVVTLGNCSSNRKTALVEVATFSSFSITAANTTICAGQTATLSVNVLSGYTIQWMKDDADLAGETSPSLSVNTAGSYKVRVTNVSLGCSRETNAIDITVVAAPLASFTVPATGCVSVPVDFVNTSTADNSATVVYTWDFGDAQTSTQQNPTHTYTVVQTFSPQLSVSYQGVGGCVDTATGALDIFAPLQPTIAATLQELCEGDISTLTVAGTFTAYDWSTGETTVSILVNAPGTYTVTTTDGNGCLATESITVLPKTDCPSNTNQLVFPELFTPNGDTHNDRWVIPNVENYGDCTMTVFDGRGRKVFETTGYPAAGWDGNYDGKAVPAGTYYFVWSCPGTGADTGTVLIIR